jgi:hypothetical protein
MLSIGTSGQGDDETRGHPPVFRLLQSQAYRFYIGLCKSKELNDGPLNAGQRRRTRRGRSSLLFLDSSQGPPGHRYRTGWCLHYYGNTTQVWDPAKAKAGAKV